VIGIASIVIIPIVDFAHNVTNVNYLEMKFLNQLMNLRNQKIGFVTIAIIWTMNGELFATNVDHKKMQH